MNKSNNTIKFSTHVWLTDKLGNICDYFNGGSHEEFVNYDGDFNLISLNSIDIEGNLKKSNKKVSYTDNSLRKDDLVMVLSDVAHGNFLGLSAIIPNDNYVLNQRMAGLRIKNKEKFSPQYLRYYINHNQKYFKSKGQGSSQLNLSKNAVTDFEIYYPKNNEIQQKIAACLSSLDDVIAGHEEKLTALEEHKKGLMQNLFPQEGETQPKYRFPEFENNGDWVEINILKIATMKARIGWQNLRTDEHLNQGEYYLVTGTDFKNNRVDWNNAKFVSYDRYIQDEHIILQEGDILITKDGSIGKVAYVNNINDRKSTLNNGIFRIRTNDNYKCEFIFHSFLSTRFKLFLDKLSGGSSIVHLYQKDFEKYLIQLPVNIEEQQKIASVLSSVDELIVAQHQKIEALKEHKKGLMQGLFPKIES